MRGRRRRGRSEGRRRSEGKEEGEVTHECTRGHPAR